MSGAAGGEAQSALTARASIAAAFGGAQVLPSSPHGDRQEIAAQRALPPKAHERPRQRQEHLMRQVLGGHRAAHQAQGERVHLREVLAIQAQQRGVLAARGATDAIVLGARLFGSTHRLRVEQAHVEEDMAYHSSMPPKTSGPMVAVTRSQPSSERM
jgi:hypothetical protein